MQLGPYRVDSQLGRGGSGTVFRARAPTGSPVAIKVLNSASRDSLARFERERRVLTELGHEQGFVQLLDAGTGPGGAYLVMELVRGGTLRDRLRRGPLSIDETVALGRALATALGHAHALGVVHRDLKPENILFTADGRPLVADLGLAKHFSPDAAASLSRTGELRGTAGYMAREQLDDSKRVGPPADVFALGAILYECLAGEPPFRGEDMLTVLRLVSEGSFVRLSKRRGDVPAWLASAIERALEPAPAARPADAVAFARTLHPSKRRARPLLLGALASLAASAAAIAVLARGGTRPLAPPPPPSPVATVATANAAVDPGRVETRRWPSTEAARLYGSSGRLTLGAAFGSTERKFAEQIFNFDVSADGRLLVGGDMGGTVRLHDMSDGRELWWSRAVENVGGLALDAEHGRVVVGSVNGEVHVLDMTNGRRQGSLVGHRIRARTAAVSPDGRFALTGGGDKVARLHDLETLRVVRVLPHPMEVVTVAFSPDGSRALTGSFDGKARVFELAKDAPPVVFEAGPHLSFGVAFSPDGKRVAAGSQTGTLRVWDLATRALLVESDTKDWIVALAFTADGERLVAGFANNPTATLDARTLKVLSESRIHAAQVSCIRIRGTRVATASWDQTVRVLDAATGTELRPMRGHAGAVAALAFSGDGARLHSVGGDMRIRTWDLADGSESATDRYRQKLTCVAPALDGSSIAAGMDNGFFAVERAGEASRIIATGAKDTVVGLERRGVRLVGASGDGTVWIGEELERREAKLEAAGRLEALSVDEKGQRALVGGAAGAELFDLETRRRIAAAPETAVLSVALSRDGRAGFSILAHGAIQRHDFANGTHAPLPDQGAPVSAIALSPDGALLACVLEEGLLELRDATRGSRVDQLELGGGDRAKCVAFSRDGRLLGVGTARGVVLVYALR